MRFSLFRQQVLQVAETFEEPFSMRELLSRLQDLYSLRNIPTRQQAAAILRTVYISERDSGRKVVLYKRRPEE